MNRPTAASPTTIATAAVIVLLAIAGCTPAAAPTGSPSGAPGSPGVTASIGPVASPTGSAEAEASIDPAIAHAISQRKQFGLRSDLEWVLAVAADPSARTFLLDFPMTRAEEDEFNARQAGFEEVAAAVNTYAATHAGEFGGVWIDQDAHTVVAAWTANAEIHRLAILAALGKPAAIEVRTVRYPEAVLRALQDRLTDQRAWLETIAATMTFSSVDIMTNQAEFGISSANPLAGAQILDHFGVPPDMLRVQSDGTGILLKDRGTVHGIVRTVAGKTPRQNDWMLSWASDRPAGGGDCGEMVGYGVAPDGTFDIDCAPGGWTFSVQRMDGDAWVTIGKGHVFVPEGGSVDIHISVDPGRPTPS